MAQSVLYSLEDEFEERNTFLYFALGLVSISCSFIDYLGPEREEPNQLHEAQDEQMSNETPPPDPGSLLI